MTEYRYFNSLCWGRNYCSEDGAHHISAQTYDDARAQIPSSVPGSSIQVLTPDGWRYAEIIPRHLGGYDCGRYSQ